MGGSMAGTREGRGRRILLDLTVFVLLLSLVAAVGWWDRAKIKTIQVGGLWNLALTRVRPTQLVPPTDERPLAYAPPAGSSDRAAPSGSPRPAAVPAGPTATPKVGPASPPRDERDTADGPPAPAGLPPKEPASGPPESPETAQPPPETDESPLAEITADGPATQTDDDPEEKEARAAERLRAALALYQLEQLEAARDELQALIADYPGTPAAAEAQRRLPEMESAIAARQCEDVLRLAAQAQGAGRFSGAREMLQAVIQGYPGSPAAGEAKSRLQVVIQAEEEQRSLAEAEARRKALAKKAEDEKAAAELLLQAVTARQKDDLPAAQRLLNQIAKDYPGTSAARDARRLEREVDEALEEWKAVQSLETAKLAHQEGRFTEARRLLERISQDHPNTPASKEAAKLILEVMASAREKGSSPVVKYREPAQPFRAAPPPRRETAGASVARDAGQRERDAAAEEEESNRALELAKAAQGEGRLDEARRLLARIPQDHPHTPAAKEASKLILEVMASAREKGSSAVVKYREPAEPFRATPPPPRETAGTSVARDADQRERDAAAEEEKSNRALELAKAAQSEGRLDEARRLLARIPQDHPNTPAAKEASKLVLEVMAAVRQKEDKSIVTYRAPAEPFRATPPPLRETAGASVARDAGQRKRNAAAEEEKSNRALELAKIAHGEGRLEEARRLLTRIPQDHPNTPAAKEASKLILEVMAAVRQKEDDSTVKYRPPSSAVPTTPRRSPVTEPPRESVVGSSRPARPSPPPGTSGSSVAGTRPGEREPTTVRFGGSRDPTPPPRATSPPASTSRVASAAPPKPPPATSMPNPDPNARNKIADLSAKFRESKGRDPSD